MYTLRDHEAQAWRNRPNADEDLYDAPPVDLLPPRKRTALMLLAFPLAWALLGALAVFLTNMFAWVLGAPTALAAVGAALTICAGFLLVMWVRR